MAGLVPFLKYQGFKGIDQSDPIRIPPGYLKMAINVDISDTGMLSMRLGEELKATGSYRCLWPKMNLGIDFSLAMRDGNLCKISTTYGETVLLSGLSATADMDFVYVNGNIYYTNGTVIGKIKNSVATAFTDPGQEFKSILPAGQLIEYFNARIYTARGNVIFYSDPLFFNSCDLRRNFKQVDGEITMMKSVTNGMYLSTGRGTYFAGGLDPDEWTLLKVAETPAFKGSAIKVGGEEVSEGTLGTAVYWTSEEGTYIGLNGGQVKNLTWKHYVPPDETVKTTAIYREDRGFGQYLMVYELMSGVGGATAETLIPLWTVSATGTAA